MLIKPTIILINTAPVGALGSMVRYAELVEQALRAQPCQVQRVNLGLTLAQQQTLPPRLQTWANHYYVWQSLRRQRHQWQNHIIHVLDGSYGYLLQALPAYNTVVTVHDLIPQLQMEGALLGPKPSLPARWLMRRTLTGLAMAKQVICVSRSTQMDLEQHVQVSAQSPQVIYSPPVISSFVNRQSSHKNYIFHLGNNAFYKNRMGVLRVFAHLQDQHDLRLILAGPPPTPTLQQLANQLGLNARIQWLINPDDATIVQHYQEAALLLFPSLYEGFGWPPLEAMAYNCPVVCSHHGSLAEVVGDAGLTAAADDYVQLAEHCRNILQTPGVADEYCQRGQQRLQHFTRAKFTDQLINTYQAMVN